MVEEPSAHVNPDITEDVEVGSVLNPDEYGSEGESNGKRAAEDDGVDRVSKKQKVGDSPAAEEKLEGESEEKEEENVLGRVRLGPKEFGSSVEMFYYFQKFMQFWPTDLDVNKYEHMVLLDLIKKGHSESDKKIGSGIQAFQIRSHPLYKNRCFFLVREDETVDDFSFRKCVDHILPLPENVKTGGGGGGGRGGRGRGGRGRGRGGKFRN